MEIIKKISSLVQKNSLRDAFKLIREVAESLSNSALLDGVEQCEQTYRYMIHYMMEGVPDDNRQRLYDGLKVRLLELADDADRLQNIKGHDSIYFSECRVTRLRNKPLALLLEDYEKAKMIASLSTEAGNYDVALVRQAEETLTAIFSAVWTLGRAGKKDVKLLEEKLSDAESPYELKSQIVSAILLANLQYYDKGMLQMLLRVYADENISEELAARIMVAVLLILSRHASRISNDEEVMQQLAVWNDSLITYQRLRQTIMTIVKAFDTDRINSKMKDEVIPGLMKLQPELKKRFMDMSKELDTVDFEVNPEWEELMDKSGLSDKLKEMQEIQMEGGDVMMMAFSNLKSFPFFNTLSNWFLPFDKNYSSLERYRELKSSVLDAFLESDAMICNSDKYSFALSFGVMPEAQKQAMMSQFEAHTSQMKEEMKDLEFKSGYTPFDSTATRYVRDLYRFFRLFRKKGDFYDPFSAPLDFSMLPALGSELVDDDNLRLVGEFYFKHGYYDNALKLFRMVSDCEANEELLEKIGYCHQATGMMAKALEYYRKAELLNPSSRWLQRKLAYMHRVTGQYDAAARYYEQLLEQDSENVGLLMHLSQCLLETDETEKALKNYYKVHYLQPENMNALRAIAWCELLTGRPEKSKEYYDRILLMEPNAQDYVNAGHRALVAHDYKGALSFYKQAFLKGEKDWEKFEEYLLEDVETLKKLGVKTEELPILTDKMRYDIEA